MLFIHFITRQYFRQILGPTKFLPLNRVTSVGIYDQGEITYINISPSLRFLVVSRETACCISTALNRT